MVQTRAGVTPKNNDSRRFGPSHRREGLLRATIWDYLDAEIAEIAEIHEIDALP